MTRRGKYNSERVQLDGYTFDSKAEARRYGALRLLVASGHIRDLRVHPRYVLQKAWIDAAGKKQSAITWTGDFQYLEDGRLVIEDVKGVRTAVFNLKLRMFKFKYPGVIVRVIPAKEV